MKQIALGDNSISVQLNGWDMVWSLKKSLDIPLSTVAKVYLRPKKLRPPWLRVPGTYVPGVIIAGTYIGRGRKEFWSSRLKSDSIVLDLTDHKFTRVVLDLPDAPKLIEEIERKIAQNRLARNLEAPRSHTTGLTVPYPAVPDGSTD